MATMQAMQSIGPPVWVTALNNARSFHFVIPFLVKFDLYALPVGFSQTSYRRVGVLCHSVNPIVGATTDGSRRRILGGESRICLPDPALSAFVKFVFQWLGNRRFRNVEKSFADLNRVQSIACHVRYCHFRRKVFPNDIWWATPMKLANIFHIETVIM